MTLKQKCADSPVEPKKRKTVGFAKTDGGVEANDCIKLFLVRNQDEVVSNDDFCIDPVDLSPFFGENGKIYGYKDLKINIWLSSVSFHAYADISYANKVDGGKGITDLKFDLESIFGESLLEKDKFLQTFCTESHCVRDTISVGGVLHRYSLNEDGNSSNIHSDRSIIEYQVVRMNLSSLPVGILYSRLVSLTFLLIDGSSLIDVTDPNWDIYFVVKKVQTNPGDYDLILLGFALIYRFYHHPDSTRLRLSLMLVLPPYQGQGHGRRLLETVNSVAIAENVYDLTMEEPSEYLQYLRSCLDTLRLLDFEPIKPAINSAAASLSTDSKYHKPSSKSPTEPPTHAVEIVRRKLKINKRQFLRVWDILVYLNLDRKNRKSLENFRASIVSRLQSEVLDKDTGSKEKRLVQVPNDYDHDMSFVVYCSRGREESDGLDGKFDDDKVEQEQQLERLVDEQIEDIVEVAEKVSLLRSS